MNFIGIRQYHEAIGPKTLEQYEEQERVEREKLEREQRMEREQEEQKALDNLISALRRFKNVHASGTYRGDYLRGSDWTEEKHEEELSIAAWAVQEAAEQVRIHFPELYMPKGTPIVGQLVVGRREIAQLRARLAQAVERCNVILEPKEEADE